jgi:hypothetical protein
MAQNAKRAGTNVFEERTTSMEAERGRAFPALATSSRMAKSANVALAMTTRAESSGGVTTGADENVDLALYVI